MNNRLVRAVRGFFAGTIDVIATPSGDTRGHMRVYTPHDKVTRGRDF